MIYNIGLFLRYAIMLFLGVKGAWYSLNLYGNSGGRWDSSRTKWTYHIPVKFKQKNSAGIESAFWYSRLELLKSRHMSQKLDTIPNKRS